MDVRTRTVIPAKVYLTMVVVATLGSAYGMMGTLASLRYVMCRAKPTGRRLPRLPSTEDDSVAHHLDVDPAFLGSLSPFGID